MNCWRLPETNKTSVKTCIKGLGYKREKKEKNTQAFESVDFEIITLTC